LVGTASSNTSFTATLTVNAIGGIGSTCSPVSFPVTGIRTPCGDGVVDAGEQCDGGPPAGGAECCSPFSCQYKADSSLCSIAGPPTDGICLSGVCVAADDPGFPVNSYSLFDQTKPRVDSDADGNFTVVWQDWGSRDGDTAGIFARRFESTGAPVGGDFQINSYTTGFQGTPDVVVHPDGNFLVVWLTFTDGHRGGVAAQSFDGAGQPVGPEFQVNTYTVEGQKYPAVESDEAGAMIVVWQSGEGFRPEGQDGSSSGVFAQRFDSAGDFLGAELMVNTYTHGSQERPAVAVDGAGRFVVTWTSTTALGDAAEQDGDGAGVFARRFSSDGSPQGSEFQVNTHTIGNQTGAAVAAAPSGEFLIAWVGPSDARCQLFDASGTAIGGELIVSPSFAQAVSADVDAANTFVVAWEGFDGGFDGIFARRYRRTGAALGSEFQVNTYTPGPQDEPSVAADSPGSFVVAWESDDEDGSGRGIFARRFVLPGPYIDHFKCYKAKDLKQPKFPGADVSLTDQRFDTTAAVTKPALVCNPAEKNGEAILNEAGHLTCYKIDDSPKIARDARPRVQAADQFGAVELELSKAFLLCVPSAKTVLP
jgi:hypothetical protein